jgi:excisionase family DNA binding protein
VERTAKEVSTVNQESRGALKAREVARLLGLNPATVYKLAAAGQLPHLRIRGAIRFRREDVEAFVARCYRPAQVEAGDGK